jgi:hypothetical protein
MPGVIRVNRTGKLLSGYFYRMDFTDDAEMFYSREAPLRGAIVAERSPTDLELGTKSPETYGYLAVTFNVFPEACPSRCPSDPGHVSEYRFPRQQVVKPTHLTGTAIGPLVPGGSWCIASAEVAARIERADLEGVEGVPVGIELTHGEANPLGLRLIQPLGKDCERPLMIEGGENVCPFCAKGRPICLDCGHTDSNCSHCGEMQWRTFDSKPSRPGDDKRLIMSPWSERRQAVLDGSLWDGSDFLNAHIESFATRRFVDFLLSIHAAPFIAEPAWVWVDKMTKGQLARLEQAKRPVKG